MLMKLLWGFAKVPVGAVLGLIPDAPEGTTLVVPWPAWIPSWPLALMFITVTVAGFLLLGLRVLRWIYGLIPVVQ